MAFDVRLRSLLAAVIAVALGAGCHTGGKNPNDASAMPDVETRDDAPIEDAAMGDAPPNPDPGRVTIHRLNRVEYDNTVRDLLGTAQKPAADFPSDDRGYGFDNIADVLSLSPLQLGLYLQAAEKLIDDAMDVPVAQIDTRKFEAEKLPAKNGHGGVAEIMVGSDLVPFWMIYSNDEITAHADLPQANRYTISARAFAPMAGPEAAKMAVKIDGVEVRFFDVAAPQAAPEIYSFTTTLSAGAHDIAFAFLNDYYMPMAMPPEDRNLFIDWVAIDGPLDLPPLKNPLRERIVTCDPAKEGAPCVSTIIRAFARRAWRRPVSDEELAALLKFVDQAQAEKDSIDVGIRLALQATLVSPHFIFRVETDPTPTSTEPHDLSPHELATRLSYFLWSAGPDDDLLRAADTNNILAPAGIQAQVTRMLGDARAEALVQNFAGQWLYTRGLADHVPDYATFPDFDADLRDAMRTETEMFVREFLFKGAPANQLLTADFGFINGRLARHYGLPAITGTAFTRVTLAPERLGLLGQGSVLTITSFPTRTSPVKRGKWVLTQLLCTPPPDPPPGVEGLIPEKIPTGSLRQRLEAHRKENKCAVCHKAMDPIGFGLEGFDGIGAVRTQDSGFPIDDSGELPGGTKFKGAVQLADLIARDQRFATCIVRQLMTYALGRPLYDYDDGRLAAITADFVAGGYKMPGLIARITQSDAFRRRRAEKPSEPQP